MSGSEHSYRAININFELPSEIDNWARAENTALVTRGLNWVVFGPDDASPKPHLTLTRMTFDEVLINAVGDVLRRFADEHLGAIRIQFGMPSQSGEKAAYVICPASIDADATSALDRLVREIDHLAHTQSEPPSAGLHLTVGAGPTVGSFWYPRISPPPEGSYQPPAIRISREGRSGRCLGTLRRFSGD